MKDDLPKRGSKEKRAVKDARQKDSSKPVKVDFVSKKSHGLKKKQFVVRTEASLAQSYPTHPAHLYVLYKRTGDNMQIGFQSAGTPIHKTSLDQKLDVIETGFPKEQLLKLKEQIQLSFQRMSKILDVSDRTIQNKPNSYRFKGSVAEKIVELSDIYNYGIEVFEDVETFRKWLNTPNPVLNEKLPLDLFSTMLGMQQVKQELARIDYGVY